MIRPPPYVLAALLALGCGSVASEWEGGIHARMAHSAERGLRVVGVPEDGPAARAGLAEGDRILAIDGEPVEGLSPEQIAARLRGPVGSTVELRVERRGRRLTLPIERAPYADE